MNTHKEKRSIFIFLLVSIIVLMFFACIYLFINTRMFIDQSFEHQRGNRHIVKINLIVHKGLSDAYFAIENNDGDAFIDAITTVESAAGYMSTSSSDASVLTPEIKNAIIDLTHLMERTYEKSFEIGKPVSRDLLDEINSSGEEIFNTLSSVDIFFYERLIEGSNIIRTNTIVSFVLITLFCFILLAMAYKMYLSLSKSARLASELQVSKDSLEHRVQERTKELADEIRERVQAQERLKEVNEELIVRVDKEVKTIRKQEQIINEQKKLADMGQMINAIAHQWRQPLNALALYGQEIVEQAELNQLTEDFLNEFKTTHMNLIEHMSSTIDDFRAFFRPDKEKVDFLLTSEIVALVGLIQIQFDASNIDIQLSCRCSDDTEDCGSFSDKFNCSYNTVKVNGYLGEFKQVIVNLLYNAKDSVLDEVEKGNISNGVIKIFIDGGTDYANLTISDNGSGIDGDIADKIFAPYFTTKEEGRGTGLGLYMSKLVIENHMNGTIQALNNSDGGASFIIKLPVNR